MLTVLCKLSDSSENGGGEPSSNTLRVQATPKYPLAHRRIQSLHHAKFASNTDIASEAKYIDYGTIIY
jgi:hypothetical protein